MRWAIAAAAMGVTALCVASARAETWQDSRASYALPGIYRVATAEPFKARELGLFASGGHGYAHGVLCMGDLHTRTSGSLAASLGIQSWLALAVRLDGRHDTHECSLIGPDDKSVAEPRFQLRGRMSLGPAWHVAGHVLVWLPGNEGLSANADAATFDMVAALTHAPPGQRWRAAANLGVRLDRSKEIAYSAERLTRVERLGLGVSESNALLLGVGGAYRVGHIELLAEWTWDLLVGARAPDVRTSPMRLATGARVPLGRAWLAEVVVEASVARHSAELPGDPLVPFEPSLSAMVGIHHAFELPRISWPRRKRAVRPVPAAPPAAPIVKAAPVEPGDVTPPDPEPLPASIQGRIVGEHGEGVSGARVVVKGQDAVLPEALTDADGRFSVTGIVPGPVEITVSAPEFEAVTRTLDLGPGQTHELELKLTPTLPAGQIKGFVRSFQGKRLRATLTVMPANAGQTGPSHRITTQDDGVFEIDVAPGTYVVEIEAEGYEAQKKTRVIVEEAGVTILNVDMRRKK